MYKLAVDNTYRGSGHHRSRPGRGWAYPLRAAVTWLIHEWRVHRSIQQLRGLDDHMLKDIGLTRMEIEAVVRFGRPCDEARWRGWL